MKANPHKCHVICSKDEKIKITFENKKYIAAHTKSS